MKKILFFTAMILFSPLSYPDFNFNDGQFAWGNEHREHRHHHRHNNSYQQGYYQQAPNVYYQQPQIRYYSQPQQPQIYYSPQPQVPIYVRPGEINPNLRPPW